MPKITWNGRRTDILESANNDGVTAPSGNYTVSVRFGRGTFNSPHQKNILRAPGITFPTKVSEQTLIGFRVINNDDTTAFGPKGSAQDVMPEDEDATDNQEHPKDPGFKAWTSYIGPAGVGEPPSVGQSSHDWHHIVEQYQNHFGYQKLNRPHNLIRIPHDIHLNISREYGNPQEFIYKKYGDPKTAKPEEDLLPLRRWLKEKEITFQTQRTIGIEMLSVFCKGNDNRYPKGYGFKNQTSAR